MQAAKLSAILLLLALTTQAAAVSVCKSLQVCDNAVDAPWTVARIKGAFQPYLASRGLSGSNAAVIFITLLPGASTAGCTCNIPAEVKLTIPVSSSETYESVSSALTAYITSKALPTLKSTAACTADTSSAYTASNPRVCTPPARPTGTPAQTICRTYRLCDTSLDYPWMETQIKSALAPLFKTLGVAQASPAYSLTLVPGATTLTYDGKTCTCKFVATLSLTIPVPKGSSAVAASKVVDDFITSPRLAPKGPQLPSLECVDATDAKRATGPTCASVPGNPLGTITCRTWALCDDSMDLPWTVQAVKSVLNPCLTKAKAPTSSVTVTPISAKCPTIGGKSCCCSNPVTVKVSLPTTAAGAEFDVCAAAALKLPNSLLPKGVCLALQC